MTVRPGDLRRRIILQRLLTTRDSFGQQSTAWTDYLAGIVTGDAKTITGATAGATTLLQCAGHGFTEGKLITIAGITGAPGMPATFGVLAPTTDAFSIALDTTGITLTLSSATATPVSGVPASIEPLRPMEAAAADAAQAALTHRLVLRFHSLLINPLLIAGLRALHVHGSVSRIFTLSAGANIDSRNRWVSILATERSGLK